MRAALLLVVLVSSSCSAPMAIGCAPDAVLSVVVEPACEHAPNLATCEDVTPPTMNHTGWGEACERVTIDRECADGWTLAGELVISSDAEWSGTLRLDRGASMCAARAVLR